MKRTLWPGIALILCLTILTAPTIFSQTPTHADSTGSTSPWRSKNDKLVREARKKRWNVQFSIGAGGYYPVGSYLDGIDPGVSGHSSLSIALTKELALRIPVSIGSSSLSSGGASGNVTNLRGSIGALFHGQFSEVSRLPS